MAENDKHDIKTPAFLVLHTCSLAYRKEFPQKAWIPGQLQKQENTAYKNSYYSSVKPILIMLTMCGIFPAYKNRSGKMYSFMFSCN